MKRVRTLSRPGTLTRILSFSNGFLVAAHQLRVAKEGAWILASVCTSRSAWFKCLTVVIVGTTGWSMHSQLLHCPLGPIEAQAPYAPCRHLTVQHAPTHKGKMCGSPGVRAGEWGWAPRRGVVHTWCKPSSIDPNIDPTVPSSASNFLRVKQHQPAATVLHLSTALLKLQACATTEQQTAALWRHCTAFHRGIPMPVQASLRLAS